MFGMQQTGSTPFYVSCQEGHLSVVRMLIELNCGVDIKMERNDVCGVFLFPVLVSNIAKPRIVKGFCLSLAKTEMSLFRTALAANVSMHQKQLCRDCRHWPVQF